MAKNERETRSEQTSGREVARSAEERGMARRSYDPFAFSPGEFFSNPFGVMRRMHDEMDRMFAGAMGQQAGRAAMGGLGSWMPAIEVSERENELCVCAELPGLKPEEVKVEVTDDALVIQGERKQEQQEEDRGRWRSERHYGTFYRTIPLPEGAKTDQARADFKNGELRVTVPVESAHARRRQIPISGGTGDVEGAKR